MSMKERDHIHRVQREIQSQLNKSYDKSFEEVNTRIDGIDKKFDLLINLVKHIEVQNTTTIVKEVVSEGEEKKFDTPVDSFVPNIDVKGMIIKSSEQKSEVKEVDLKSSLEALDKLGE